MEQCKATVVLDTDTVAPERCKRTHPGQPRRQPRYNVVLWNDDDHTYEYVICMLQKLFGYPRETGKQMASKVDHSGKVILLTTTREHAELKREQIHAHGKDPMVRRCAGSMSSTIESQADSS